MLALPVQLKFKIVLNAPKKVNRLSVPSVEAALAFSITYVHATLDYSLRRRKTYAKLVLLIA